MKRIQFSLFGCDSGGLVRSCNDCTADEPNRIVHVAFVRKGATVNETESGLITSLLALELTCDAYIVRNVNGTMAEASYQTGKGFGKQINRVLSGTHSITITDPDIINNIKDFWNPSIANAQNYNMYFFTSSYGWAVKKPLSISPSAAITDDITTFIEGNIKIDWSDKGLPVPIKIGEDNVDLLEDCQPLFVNETGFTKGVGDESTLSSGNLTATLPSGDTLNISLSSGSTAIDSVSVTNGTLPTGVTASVAANGLSVILAGTPTVDGTYAFSLRAANACGVAAEFVVKIVVT